MLQFVGPKSNFNTEVEDAIKAAVASEVGVEPSGVQLEVTAGFGDFTHLWIRMKDLDGKAPDEPDKLPQGQQVRNNLTAVLEDITVAQAFINRALAFAGITEIKSTARRLSEAPTGLIIIDSIPVVPTVMCFPVDAGLTPAAGAGSIGLLGLAAAVLFLLLDIAYYIRKKLKNECKEGEGDDEDDDDDDELPDPMDLPPPDEVGDVEEAEDGGAPPGEEDGADGDPFNESGVNMLHFLNATMVPGMDDSPEMKVNPVLMYVIERKKREEKLRLEMEAAEEDGGGGSAAEAAKDEGPKEGGKASAIKRLGWNLSKDAAVQADTTKQLKNIEAFLQKSMEIDIRKAPMKATTRAGAATRNPIHASALAAMELRKKASGSGKKAQSVLSAELARAQLKNLKLKTKIAEEEEEKKEGDGEEGEEGDENLES